VAANGDDAPSRAQAVRRAVLDGLEDWGLERFVHVPSSHVAALIRGLQERGIPGVLANREEEAVGLAGGLRLTGEKACVVMQDNGFGNALTALSTFAKAYHVGLPIVANTRGGVGEYNAMIHSFSAGVPGMLAAAGIHVERLGPAHDPLAWRSTVAGACELADISFRPVVVLLDLLHPLYKEAA
jgi:sulfopyruvate decarboxylase subunit alpha